MHPVVQGVERRFRRQRRRSAARQLLTASKAEGAPSSVLEAGVLGPLRSQHTGMALSSSVHCALVMPAHEKRELKYCWRSVAADLLTAASAIFVDRCSEAACNALLFDEIQKTV